jgi:hypothetical protein
LAEIGDLVGMYNFVTHERMHDSLVNNIERVKIRRHRLVKNRTV